MKSKTRTGPNSELSSSAPSAHLSADSAVPRTDQSRSPKPLSSKPLLQITANQARKKFGRKIQVLREQIGLSHEQLSKECGITVTKLKLIEAGQDETRLFTIITLAEKLRTTAEDLLKETE